MWTRTIRKSALARLAVGPVQATCPLALSRHVCPHAAAGSQSSSTNSKMVSLVFIAHPD